MSAGKLISNINLDELPTTTSVSADFFIFYDASENRWAKTAASTAAFTDISVTSLAGDGDTNTKLVFTDDAISFQAGGVTFFDLTETTQDVLTWNAGAVDIDFTCNKLTSGTWLTYNGGTDTLTLSGGTNNINGTLVLNNAAADVDTTCKKLTSGNWLVYDAGLDTLTSNSALTHTGAVTLTGGNFISNSASGDFDFTVKKNTSGNAIVFDAGNVTLDLNATTITITGATNITGATYVACGTATTLTSASFGKIIKLDTATGSTATLPDATGSGGEYIFEVSVLATSNSHIIKVPDANNTMQGVLLSVDDTSDNCVGFIAAAGTSDTITLNRTTTGSVSKGEYIKVRDFAADVWQVSGMITNTGTPATPFSATV